MFGVVQNDMEDEKEHIKKIIDNLGVPSYPFNGKKFLSGVALFY